MDGGFVPFDTTSNIFDGTKFYPDGATVAEGTVFCHDCFGKNRYNCPYQVAINLMLRLHTA